MVVEDTSNYRNPIDALEDTPEWDYSANKDGIGRPDRDMPSLRNHLKRYRRLVEGREAIVDSLQHLREVYRTDLEGVKVPDALVADIPRGTMYSYEGLEKILVTEEAKLRPDAEQVVLLSEVLEACRNELLPRLTARRSQYDFSPAWVDNWLLGKGAYGKATLWLKQNHDGIVTDVSYTNPTPDNMEFHGPADTFLAAHSSKRRRIRPRRLGSQKYPRPSLLRRRRQT